MKSSILFRYAYEKRNDMLLAFSMLRGWALHLRCRSERYSIHHRFMSFDVLWGQNVIFSGLPWLPPLHVLRALGDALTHHRTT